MAYSVRVILDSIAPCGVRLVTWELTYPRMVHADLMSHKMLSRNGASNRAIPIAKSIERVLTDPVLPVWWGKNQPGMEAEEEIDEDSVSMATEVWLDARNAAVFNALRLQGLNVHKGIVNRLLEPFSWMTIILSTTEHENWFAQRDHKSAQRELSVVAETMHAAFEPDKWTDDEIGRRRHRANDARIAQSMLESVTLSRPTALNAGEWHLPYLPDRAELEKTYSLEQLKRISTGRCARVSYLNHNGVRDPEDDLKLCAKLADSRPMHASPFEHVAQAMAEPLPSGNFRGWKQFRKEIPGESGTRASAIQTWTVKLS